MPPLPPAGGTSSAGRVVALGLLLLAACASGPGPSPAAHAGAGGGGGPADDAASAEVTQLLGTARAGEARWRREAGRARALRERVLAVSSAAGLALAIKDLYGLANRSLLQVVSSTQAADPGPGVHVRPHAVGLSVSGSLRALLAYFAELEAQAPRVRIARVVLGGRQDGADATAAGGAYTATLELQVLERVALPPPDAPPPSLPEVPLESEAAVRALRGYILDVDRALTALSERTAILEAADAEIGAAGSVAAAALAALFPAAAGARLREAAAEGGKVHAVADAADEGAAAAWAAAVADHPAMAPGVVVSTERVHEPGDAWPIRVTLDGTAR